MAATLQVGRSTLREAMAALDVLGIVEVRPGSGSYLKAESAELFPQAIKWSLMLGRPGTRDLVEIRQALEVLAARLAAERATAEDVERLRSTVERMQDPGVSVEDFVEADLAFHLELAQIAGNAVLSDVLHSVRSLLLAWFERTIAVEGTREQTVPEHVAVYEAVAAHEPLRAERLMRQLMDNADQRLTLTF